MAQLELDYTSHYKRDYKKMSRYRDMSPLREVLELIRKNDQASQNELKRHHGSHLLTGKWIGSFECHVCNAGDWLLVWAVEGDVAVLQRMGTHNEIFRN